MHKDYYCAYHQTQVICSFCRCQDCLLPACPTCVKLHNEEHGLNRTQPQYQNMTEVFKQINNEYEGIARKVQGLAKSLLLVQRNRKDQMMELKRAINQKSKQILTTFQKAIQSFDYIMICAINELDERFIQQIQSIDDKIHEFDKQIVKECSGLQSEQSLKTVISYFELEKKNKFQEYIQHLTKQVEQLSNKRINISFSKDFSTRVLNDILQIASISQVRNQAS